MNKIAGTCSSLPFLVQYSTPQTLHCAVVSTEYLVLHASRCINVVYPAKIIMYSSSGFRIVDNQQHSDGLEINNYPETNYDALTPKWEKKDPAPKISGLRRGLFWVLCIAAVILIVAGGVGGGIGAQAHNKNTSHEGSIQRYSCTREDTVPRYLLIFQ